MTYIYQTYRSELDEAIKNNAHFLKGKVLDIGAGVFDRYSRYFKVGEYVRMNLEAGTNTQLVGSVEAIPANDCMFDAVVCTQVLGDIFYVQKAVCEMSRVLKAGGRVLFTESFMDPLHDLPHDYWRFTEHSLKQLFEKAGFKIIVLERIGGYHSTMAQLKARYRIEKYNLYEAWYGRILSGVFKVLGMRALRQDARDASKANKLFAQGWLLVAEKEK